MDDVGYWTSQLESTSRGDVDTSSAIPANSTTTMLPVRWGAVALGLIVVATMFGNVLLCVAVVTERRLQNMTNYFLASLAVADLLVAVVVMPLAVAVEIYGQSLCIQLPSSLRQPHFSPSVSALPVHAPTTCSHSVNSPLLPSITPSLFHCRLKTYLFHKSFPP